MKLAKVAAEEPFVLTAMLSLVGATVWLNLRPQLLLQFFYSPEMLALTHVVTLGFASSIVQGVMQRLAPRTFKLAPIPRGRALLQCALYLIGAMGVVAHFLLERGRSDPSDHAGVAWSALAVIAAGLLLAFNFREVIARALTRGSGDWAARWVAASLAHFVLAAALGALFAMARAGWIGGAIVSAPLLDRLGAHLHLALLGWIGGAMFGYQLKLLPATRASGRTEAWRFGLLQLGLIGLVAALLAGRSDLARWGALPIAASIVLRSVPAVLGIGGNRPGAWEAIAHAVLLALAGIGVALSFDAGAGEPERRLALELVYGYVALFGWVVLTVMGTSWKLFSLWVWEERFLPEKGTKPIPAVYQLPSRVLRDVSGTGLTLGAIGVASAVMLGSLPLLRVALAIQLAGVLCFLAQFARIARWELLNLEYRPK